MAFKCLCFRRVRAADVFGAPRCRLAYTARHAVAHVRRSDGEAHLELDGWYVGASWILTGQSREYEGGRFRGVDTGGTGAWESTARYSTIDLNDAGEQGGEPANMLLGLNW